jgi:oligopeptide/dipeptide ABC transporter ATP-binding protein
MNAPAALLEVEHLSVQIRTRRHTVQALTDVALRVGQGEVVGLVGESGGGKTMIARSIIASLPRGARVSGTVRLAGRDVLGLSGRELIGHRGRGAALCFQNPRRALSPVRTVGRQIADRLAVHRGLTGDAAREEAIRLLRDVGLRNAEQRVRAYPHELSGGMSQRVMIATALACRPRLLLADEPTTGLDVTLTRDILELFRAVADEQDRGVLLVSHDLASIAEFCDRLVVLYAGTVVEQGPVAQVLDRPAHPYTRTLLDAVPEIDGGALVATGGAMPLLHRMPTSCPFAPRCAHADVTCTESRPQLAALDADREAACFHPLGASERLVAPRLGGRIGPAIDAATAVRVRDLDVAFRGRLGAPSRRVLHGVDLTVARGETLGIVGESGCGKTTLARVLLGLVRPAAGHVEVGGIDIASVSGRERRRFHTTVQMVFQDPVGSLSPRRTVEQAIREPMLAAGVVADEQQRRLTGLVQRVGLDPSILGRRPHELSGGQAQRVAIARALSVEPMVVVLDEPTSALDVTVQAQILELVGELAQNEDRALVFISHDLAVVRSMCDRVAVLYLGRIVEYGDAADVFARPRHPYTQALLAGAPRLGRQRSEFEPVRLARELHDDDQRSGCPLRPRCPFAGDVCGQEPPLAPAADGRLVACWRADEIASGMAPLAVAATSAPTPIDRPGPP